MKRLIVLILIFISCDNVDDSSLIIEKIPDKPILILSIDKIDEINYQTINFISESTGLDFNNLNQVFFLIFQGMGLIQLIFQISRMECR